MQKYINYVSTNYIGIISHLTKYLKVSWGIKQNRISNRKKAQLPKEKGQKENNEIQNSTQKYTM